MKLTKYRIKKGWSEYFQVEVYSIQRKSSLGGWTSVNSNWKYAAYDEEFYCYLLDGKTEEEAYKELSKMINTLLRREMKSKGVKFIGKDPEWDYV